VSQKAEIAYIVGCYQGTAPTQQSRWTENEPGKLSTQYVPYHLIQTWSQRLRREIEVWKRLSHANIVPLLGTTDDFGPCTAMVSPWMDNGNLTVFLESNIATLSDSYRLELVSPTTSLDVIVLM
jgi:serine/threonine protein kinase